MENGFLRLIMAAVLAITVSTKSYAINFKYGIDYMCENKNEFIVGGYSNGRPEMLKNTSKTFCGIKSKGGVYMNNFFGGDIFFGFIYRNGDKIDFSNNNPTNRNIVNNENDGILKKGFYATSKILAIIWTIWGGYNNLRVGLNYLGNYLGNMIGEINIDLEGIL